jgi:hypothetical protein
MDPFGVSYGLTLALLLHRQLVAPESQVRRA